MKTLTFFVFIALSCLLVGCIGGREAFMVVSACTSMIPNIGAEKGDLTTTTFKQVANDGKDAIGYFTVKQTRWVPKDPDQKEVYKNNHELCSQVEVSFTSTAERRVNFNFESVFKNYRIRDAVINLGKGEIVTTEKLTAPYDAMDYWRVVVSNISYSK